jgi:hypothetical protein
MTKFMTFLVFSSLICFQSKGLSYGYGIKDPLIIGLKSVKIRLKKKDWTGIAKDVKTLSPQIINAKKLYGLNIQEEFDKAVSNKDIGLLANTWINITANTCRLHLWWNLHEGLSNMKRSKPRIDSINRLFKDVLGKPVKKKDLALYKKIMTCMMELRASLGSPGAFGVGQVDPDINKFFDKYLEFQDLIFEAFPPIKSKGLENIKEDKASEQAIEFLNKSKGAKDFLSRNNQLEKSLAALKLTKKINWKALFIKLYPLMGKPADDKEAEQPVDKNFSEVIDELVKTIKK